jgi:hypothetical protein
MTSIGNTAVSSSGRMATDTGSARIPQSPKGDGTLQADLVVRLRCVAERARALPPVPLSAPPLDYR